MSKLKIAIQNSKLLKFLLLILTFTFLLLTFPFPAFAQTLRLSAEEADRSGPSASPSVLPNYDPSTTLRMGLPSNVSPTSPLYTDLLVNNLFHSFSCLAVGQSVIGQPCLTYQVTKNAQGMLQGVPMLSSVNTSGGVLGATTSLIGTLYANPPVRTIDYLASVGQGLGIVKEANAQVVGSGAQVLSPILGLWQTSRNISYVLLIIIFLIIGLMVMFRSKINPQTVITAQAAIPGLVVGLILITFSYFLAGLVSDMAFVGTNVVGYYFAAAQGQTSDPQRINLAQRLSDKSMVQIYGSFVETASNHGGETLNKMLALLPPDVARTIDVFMGLIGAQLLGPLGGTLGVAGPSSPTAGAGTGPMLARLNLIGFITSALIPIITTGAGYFSGSSDFLGLRSFIVNLIVVGILIYVMLRLLFRLISAYLTIIFLTLSAPFQFLFAALPGRQGIATGWIRNMLGNVLVFPAVIAVFYFVAVLLAPIDARIRNPDFPLKISQTNQMQNRSSIPAVYAQGTTQPIGIVGRDNFPLFGGMDLTFISILLVIGALMALPAIPDIVIRAVGKASEAGQLIGQEIGAGARGGQGYVSQYGSRGSQTIQQLSTGVAGERQWMMGTKGPVKQITRPGAWQAGQNIISIIKGRGTTGGAGRTRVGP